MYVEMFSGGEDFLIAWNVIADPVLSYAGTFLIMQLEKLRCLRFSLTKIYGVVT